MFGVSIGQEHAAGQDFVEPGLKLQGVYTVCKNRGQRLAHSLRTGRLGLVPACVQPLPEGLNAGNEPMWTPVEVGKTLG